MSLMTKEENISGKASCSEGESAEASCGEGVLVPSGGRRNRRKNALLLFSKLPEPGLVKTRLTTLKDGVFPPETASALYHCMLFDVVEICCAALSELEACGELTELEAQDEGAGRILDEYEFVISTAPAENVPKMRELFFSAGEWPRPLKFIADKGASFDEHYNDAFDQVWESGADCILSMGADMPALTVRDIIGGFRALHKLMESPDCPDDGLVISPDQEMGVSVIGWTRNTPAAAMNASDAQAPSSADDVSREASFPEDAVSPAAAQEDPTGRFTHTGVYYNQQGLTVLPAYIQKAREAGLPAIYLPPIPDVDTMADLMHNITLVEALNYCAPFDGNTPPWRTAAALEEMGLSEVRVAPNDLRDPRAHIDTPDPAAQDPSAADAL